MSIGLPLLALLLLQLSAALGLMAKQQGEQQSSLEESPADFANPTDVWLHDKLPVFAHNAVGHLPGIGPFTAQWKEFLLEEPAEVVPVPGVRLMLGVFTTGFEAAYRKVIRQTWMNRNGVCTAEWGPNANCSVYVAFVQGAPGESDHQGDMMLLPISENMDQGKSFEFFRHAVEACPWATHYGKMDSDVFPHLNLILKSMTTRPGCEGFFGKPWTCAGRGCPGAECGPPVDSDFLRYNGSDTSGERCWSYMQGGLYILTGGLARAALKDRVWEQDAMGIEDMKTGEVVSNVARKQGLCVDTWTDGALVNSMYFHLQPGLKPVGVSETWNDFYPGPALRPVAALRKGTVFQNRG